MKTLKQKLEAIIAQLKLGALLAQAKGTRWDVVAARVCGTLSLLAGASPYVHLIPGKTGAIIAGLSGAAAALLPRATKAAGLLSAAYGQQTPLLKVLPQLFATLLAGPSLVAQARAAEAAQIQAEENAKAAQAKQIAEAEMAAQIQAGVEKHFQALMEKTGEFSAGSLGKAVPALALQANVPALAAEAAIAVDDLKTDLKGDL